MRLLFGGAASRIDERGSTLKELETQPYTNPRRGFTDQKNMIKFDNGTANFIHLIGAHSNAQ